MNLKFRKTIILGLTLLSVSLGAGAPVHAGEGLSRWRVGDPNGTLRLYDKDGFFRHVPEPVNASDKGTCFYYSRNAKGQLVPTLLRNMPLGLCKKVKDYQRGIAAWAIGDKRRDVMVKIYKRGKG